MSCGMFGPKTKLFLRYNIIRGYENPDSIRNRLILEPGQREKNHTNVVKIQMFTFIAIIEAFLFTSNE